MARATRSKKDVCVEDERERGRGLREGGGTVKRVRKRVGHGRRRWVGEGIQLIVGKLLTSDWNAP